MAIWMLLHLNSLCRIWLLHLIISNRRQAIMSLSPFLSVSDFHVTSVCRRLFINHLSSDCWEVEYVISNQKLRWDIYKPHSLMVSSNSNPAKKHSGITHQDIGLCCCFITRILHSLHSQSLTHTDCMCGQWRRGLCCTGGLRNFYEHF